MAGPVLSLLLPVALGIACLSCNAYAETSVTFGVEIEAAPVLEVRLYDGADTSGSQIADGGTKTMSIQPGMANATFGSTSMTVSVGTSNPTGYNLTMYASDTSLSSGTNTIPSLASGSFYCTPELSLANDSSCTFTTNSWGYRQSTDSINTYKAIPSSSSPDTLTNYTDGAVNEDNTIVTFGTRVGNTKPAGTYTTTINFVATANPVTYIQNIDASECTATPITAYDSRDYQGYTIQRLEDGNCWMMDNLNLGATTLSDDLDDTNTNMASGSTITAANFNSYNLTPSSVSNTVTSNTPSTMLGVPGGPADTGMGSRRTPEYVVLSGSDSTSGTAYGALYNYCAATAKTICITAANYSDATYDLCPAGWRLPTGGSSGEFSALYANTAYDSYAKMRASIIDGGAAFTLSGVSTGSTISGTGTIGGFWSSTNSGDYNASALLFSVNSSIYPDSGVGREEGHSIRCILDEPTIADVTYLQDVTPRIGENTAIGTTVTLKDKRDNQDYVVKKLDDGRVWMITNLNLGATTLTTDLTSANTNLSTTVTASTFNGWKKSSGSGTSTSAEFIPVSGTDSTSGTAYGTLYNYCAASAGTICESSNSSNASYDLCPAGWRLPTSKSGGEFATLYANASYNTYDKMRASIANGGAAFALAGDFLNSTSSQQGSQGCYWSSTYTNISTMYIMYLNASNAYPVNPSNFGARSRGYSIRCILKATA